MNRRSNRFVFDFLAPEVKLNFNGKSAVPTKIGMVMSLMCLAIFIYLTYYIVNSFFDTSRPKISSEIITPDRKSPLNLTELSIYPVILVYESSSSLYLSLEEAEKYLHVEVYVKRYKHDPVTNAYYPDFRHLKLERCGVLIDRGQKNVISHDQKYQKTIDYYKNNAYCIDLEGKDIVIAEKAESTDFSEYFVVEFFPCILGAQCHPASALSNIEFVAQYPTKVINNGNLENPIEYYTIDEDYEGIITGLQSTKRIKMMKTDIIDDRGFLRSESLRKTYLSKEDSTQIFTTRDSSQTTCLPSQVFTPGCVSYNQKVLLFSKNIQKIYREYKGIVESISDVGGMIELVFLMFSTIYGFYHSTVHNDAMIQAVYGIDPPTRSKMICRRKKVGGVDRAKQEKEMRETYEQLSKTINEDLNIVTIIKELNDLLITIAPLKDSNTLPNIYSLIKVKHKPSLGGKKEEVLSETKRMMLPQETPIVKEENNIMIDSNNKRSERKKSHIVTIRKPMHITRKNILKQGDQIKSKYKDGSTN